MKKIVLKMLNLRENYQKIEDAAFDIYCLGGVSVFKVFGNDKRVMLIGDIDAKVVMKHLCDSNLCELLMLKDVPPFKDKKKDQPLPKDQAVPK